MIYDLCIYNLCAVHQKVLNFADLVQFSITCSCSPSPRSFIFSRNVSAQYYRHDHGTNKEDNRNTITRFDVAMFFFPGRLYHARMDGEIETKNYNQTKADFLKIRIR